MDENRLDALKSEFKKEYPEFISFISTHGRVVASSLLLALVITLGFKMFVTRKSSSVADAAVAFANAKSVADLEGIVSKYGSTPTAPLAYMSLAKAYFDSGDYDMALGKYIDFQSEFPDHPLATAAELNTTACLEAKGQIDEAQSGYEAFLKKHPDHYLANEALFGKARCFEQKGLWEQARTVYEDYMVANPRGVWFPRAEDALKEVDRHIETKGATASESPS